jgi:uncharacterized protein YecT (DUF1311 family)
MRKKTVIPVAVTLLLVSMSQSVVVSRAAFADDSFDEFQCEYTSDLDEMNDCAMNAYVAVDEQLKNVFKNLSSQLSVKKKEQLEEAQKLWRKFCEGYCDFAAYPVFDEPGYPFHKHDCLGRVTKQHLKNLEGYNVRGTPTASRADDQRLDDIYHEVMNQLYSQGDKLWLKNAQEEWQKFRDAYCGLTADKNGCLERVTRQHIENLERYIEDLDV